MGKEKSEIWKYFTLFPDGKTSECKKCKKQFNVCNRSTGNMWQHAQNKHGIVNTSATYYSNATSALGRTQLTVDKMFSGQSKYKKDSTKYQDLTLMLCKYVIQESIPISKVQSEAFVSLMTGMNPQ